MSQDNLKQIKKKEMKDTQALLCLEVISNYEDYINRQTNVRNFKFNMYLNGINGEKNIVRFYGEIYPHGETYKHLPGGIWQIIIEFITSDTGEENIKISGEGFFNETIDVIDFKHFKNILGNLTVQDPK